MLLLWKVLAILSLPGSRWINVAHVLSSCIQIPSLLLCGRLIDLLITPSSIVQDVNDWSWCTYSKLIVHRLCLGLRIDIFSSRLISISSLMTHVRWNVHTTGILEDLLWLLAAIGHKNLILLRRAQHWVAIAWTNRPVRQRIIIFDVKILLTFLEICYRAGHFMLWNLVCAEEFIHEIHHVLQLWVNLLEVLVKISLVWVVRLQPIPVIWLQSRPGLVGYIVVVSGLISHTNFIVAHLV